MNREIKRGRSAIWPYLLLAPALAIMVAVVIVPIIQAVLMSFQSYNLAKPKKIGYIGLANYAKLFADEQFWKSLGRTGIWVVCAVGFQFLFGFIMAELLNQYFKGRGVVRAVSLIPWVTPGVLIALMWRWLFDGNYGVINDLLMRLGIIHENVAWLSKMESALPSVIITIIWQGIPFFALMLLAGLQGIPGELYEAADIDGATGPQKLFYVTIPALKNTIAVTTMLRVIWVANSVDVIWNMTEGGPAYASQTLSVYVYKQASTLNMGYASAMAIMLMLVLLVAAIPYLRITFRSQEG